MVKVTKYSFSLYFSHSLSPWRCQEEELFTVTKQPAGSGVSLVKLSHIMKRLTPSSSNFQFSFVYTMRYQSM